MGEVGHDEDGAKNDLVFDDDQLTWGDVARAFGVEETLRYTRSRASTSQVRATKASGKRLRQLQLEDEEEEEVDNEEEMEEGFDEYKSYDKEDEVELPSEDEEDADCL
uniref:Uncharacterized protein n=1 Tax=Nelumbo nucifera TaxID=4432 RepID=A0A822YDG9_NELNU|nr:TPA_asm: hypothetical protein HUJ06_030564 [Nelumbo nucifera]